MDFLIDIEHHGNQFFAIYSNGRTVELEAATYHDAVLEADLLDAETTNE